MTRKKQSNRSTTYVRKKNSRLGWIIAIIVLVPILFGLYLYYTQQVASHLEDEQTEKSSQIALIKELQIPVSSVVRQEQIIRHVGYTVSYNRELKIPNWVSYELTQQETSGVQERGNRFIPDPLVKGAMATNADYSRSGYDKGHMAPAGDMKWSRQAMHESFYFSNICPQHPQLNRRGWKVLEEKIRNWADTEKSLIVICGPVVDGQGMKTIGNNKVAVPRQFFKVVLAPFARPVKAVGFLFDNREAGARLSSYAVSIDSIEALTGLDFFSTLPDEIEQKIEADNNYKLWAN